MGEIDLSVSGECFSPRFVGFWALKVPEKCDSFSGARIAPCRIYEVFFCNLVDFPQGAILADRINLSGALRAFLLNSRSSGDPRGALVVWPHAMFPMNPTCRKPCKIQVQTTLPKRTGCFDLRFTGLFSPESRRSAFSRRAFPALVVLSSFSSIVIAALFSWG